MSQPRSQVRYAVVGTGARAEMFVRALAVDYRDTARLVGFVDANQARMEAHNRLLSRLGASPVPTHPPAEFAAMLDRQGVDAVIVTSVDRTHADYIVGALEAGRKVITEKPMTVDATSCRRILDAAKRSGQQVTVTFNYRYNPLHQQVARLLSDGVIGEINSVHFEWLLDVRHGADYFRRWHRDKVNSGGLLVHKASHHFDLVNWWLRAEPVEVYALGKLCFYGRANGLRNGYARDYVRAHGSPEAQDDPFALRLADNPRMRELYLDAEHLDGYHRDQNVFGEGITIEDDMALVVRYTTGATMTYHLIAYAPWEGYRIAFNGSRGRLELDVVESDHVSPAAAREVKGAIGKGTAAEDATSGDAGRHSGSFHGVEAAAEEGSVRLQVRRFWEKPYDVAVPGYTRSGHGGADVRMLAEIFGGDRGADPLGLSATERDGALALLTGLAGNRCLETRASVAVADLLDLSH